MSKRLIRFLSLLAVLSLVLAACGGDGGGDTAATGDTAPADTTADTQAPSDDATDDTEAPSDDTGDEAPAGELGTVTVASGEAIQIRSLNAISGDTASLGIPNQRAVELAIADYGPIHDHEVSMGTGLDDLCSA